MFNFVFLCPMRWFQFNSRIVRTHFASMMTLDNWKMIAETRSYIFRWRSRFRRRGVCLSSLNLEISRRHLPDYVKELYLSACRAAARAARSVFLVQPIRSLASSSFVKLPTRLLGRPMNRQLKFSESILTTGFLIVIVQRGCQLHIVRSLVDNIKHQETVKFIPERGRGNISAHWQTVVKQFWGEWCVVESRFSVT